MKNDQRHWIAILFGIGMLAVLIWFTFEYPMLQNLHLSSLSFLFLIIFTMTFGVPLGGGLVSLLPMTLVASYLAIGGVTTSWFVFLGALVHGLIRSVWGNRLGQPPEATMIGKLSQTLNNAVIQSLSIFIAGRFFENLGGTTQLNNIQFSDVSPLLGLSVSYISINYLLVALYLRLQGAAKLVVYVTSLRRILLFETLPLLFSPLVALIYNRLGGLLFFYLSLAIVSFSLVTHSLAHARERLERRVKEISSLQTVSEALSASLDIKTILSTIHSQLNTVMPVTNFYVALWNSDTEEISFPYVYDHGKLQEWRPRSPGNGLLEHVIRTQKPLLITNGNISLFKNMGINVSRPLPLSYLGVPMIAGTNLIGVITVQSFIAPKVYDKAHEEFLSTISSQAAVAIQNARLYQRTDQALTSRVQELDSILRTVGEGIVFVNLQKDVLMANRAMTELINVPQSELIQVKLDQPLKDRKESFLTLVGYNHLDFDHDCQVITQGEHQWVKRALDTSGFPQQHLACILSPVQNQLGDNTGWLLVFRNLTEEHELARLQDEMMHMLVHDLRSPLSTLQGSLGVIEDSISTGNMEGIKQLLTLAKHGSERMLALVNQLLDISQFEGGKMPLQLKLVEVETLLSDAISAFGVMAARSGVNVDLSIEPDLPALSLDPVLIGRLLSNLLDNAYKFTPDGGKIRLWARREMVRGTSSVLIGVTDNGPGISLPDQSRIFNKFQQVNTQAGRKRGSGLGLYYCRMAVEAHGGRVWVESTPGRGSTFVISLPLRNLENHRST